MEFLASLLPTLAVLGLLILIHEYGHFIACRMTGVDVEKFSIGFGPEIFHWQTGRTRYAISLLPLGGFVKPAGESIGEMEEGQEPKPGDYLAAPLWSRIFIVCAGVLMNYLLAFVLFAGIFMMGRPVPGTTVGGFVDGYPAIQSELEEMDQIVAVNSTPVKTWSELTSAMDEVPSASVVLTVNRRVVDQVATIQIPLTAKEEVIADIFGKEKKVRRMGIMTYPEAAYFEKFGFVESIGKAWTTGVEMTINTHKAIFYLMLGKLSPKSLAGPIGIVSMTGSAAQMGLVYVLQLMAVLSISLAVINLLPIPALDGGHLFFLIIEGILRRPVSLAFQEKATQIGFLLLMGLMVFVIYNDLANLNVVSKIVSLVKGT